MGRSSAIANERLARLEEGQKAVHQRINDVKLLAAIIALNGAMVGSVVWLARQERPIGHYEKD